MWAITTRLLEYELASASAALLVALSLGLWESCPQGLSVLLSALEAEMRWGIKKSP